MLQLRNVQKSYTEPDGSRLPILDIPQFDVTNGEQMALVGKSGCGKTTHNPTALSVGEQQRVAVARALANKPSLLLADEPTANIDPRNQKKIVDLIRDTCREESVSLIIVTHSLEVAGQFQRVDRLEEINMVTVAAVGG